MSKPMLELSTEQLAVLRTVARMDLSISVALSKQLGRSVTDDLVSLRAHGFVREVKSPRSDGTPNYLHAITSMGKEALRLHDELNAAPLPTVGRRVASSHETYLGNEMLPFGDRAGSSDALKYPSRVGDERVYREEAREPTRAEPLKPGK